MIRLGFFILATLATCANLSSSSVLDCCRYLRENGEDEDAQGALNCIRSETAVPPQSSMNFILLSYSTSNIYSYAWHASIVNAAYAAYHGYSYKHFLSPMASTTATSAHAPQESQDARWNKVKIVLDSMKKHAEQANSTTYFVWLDSDLAIVDLGLSLEGIVMKHPHADLIISRETRPENGFANTGCFIIKHTQFSINLLSAWWSAFSRETGMDQHALHRLWIDDTLSITSHTALLQPNSINSQTPLHSHHTDSCPVLHLAGFSQPIRMAMLRLVSTALCRQASKYAHKPMSTVGMLRPLVARDDIVGVLADAGTLLQNEENRLQNEVLRLEARVGTKVQVGVVRDGQVEKSAQISHILSSVQSYLDRARDMRQCGDGHSCPPRTAQLGILSSLYHTLHTAFTTTEMICHSDENMHACMFGVGRSDERGGESLRVGQALIDVGFDLAVLALRCWDDTTPRSASEPSVSDSILSTFSPPISLPVLLDQLRPLVEGLVAGVIALTPDRTAQALYYRFKLHHLSTQLASLSGNVNEEINALRNALACWEEMGGMGWFGSGNALLDPIKEVAPLQGRLGSLLCVAGEKSGGIMMIEASVSLVDRVWGHALREDGATAPGTAPVSAMEFLVEILLSLASCKEGLNPIQTHSHNAHLRTPSQTSLLRALGLYQSLLQTERGLLSPRFSLVGEVAQALFDMAKKHGLSEWIEWTLVSDHLPAPASRTHSDDDPIPLPDRQSKTVWRRRRRH